MIITRTPMRISLGGGGTDLPSYYEQYGGFVLSAAINKYIYIAVNKPFFEGYWLKYSEIEHATRIEDIQHRLIREALQMFKVRGPFEMTSMADVPGGTGLGSSGSFAVGLVHAILAFDFRMADAEMLARAAIEIEMERLKDPVGKQDQYIAAYGGLLCQEYSPDGTVAVSQLKLSQSTVHELRDSLMLFFAGNTRTAAKLLEDQRTGTQVGDKAMIESLHFAKQSGLQISEILQTGRVFEYGPLMHEHWLRKRSRSKGMTSPVIDDLYELGRTKGGALGGKLVGAGGGGFLLFQTEDRRKLRNVMTEAGAVELDFSFDFDGSVVQVRNRG